MQALEKFQDMVVELEQYRQATDTPKSATIEQPDCAEVIESMVELVSQEPEIAAFYGGALRQYRRTNPDRIRGAIDLIDNRIDMMHDLGLLSEGEIRRKRRELERGDLARREAKFFFTMFKHVLEPEQIPKIKARRKPVRKPLAKIESSVDEVGSPTVEHSDLGVSYKPPDELPKSDESTTYRKRGQNPSKRMMEVDDQKQWPGKEYDILVDSYRHHPLNTISARYKRDFEGFKGDVPKALNMEVVGDSQDDGCEWFIAHMKRFPLLDGLLHERILHEKIEAGLKAMLELHAGNVTASQAKKLEQIAAEGAGAYMTMYECNLRLVMSIANRYPENASYTRMDMVAEGCIGLRRGIQKYEPQKGFKLSTYATYWIRQAITRKRPSMAYEAYLPADVERRAIEIRKKSIEAHANNLPNPTDEELKDLGYSEEEIFAARHILTRNRFSLDRQLSDDSNGTFYDILPGHEVDYVLQSVDKESRSLLSRLVEDAKIEPRERLLLSLREGVVVPGVDYSQSISINGYPACTIGELLLEIRAGVKQLTLDELGAVTGITRERARQLVFDTSRVILNYNSIHVLTERLNLSEEEQKEFLKYAERRFFTKPGRPSPKAPENEPQRRASNVISLLHLVDDDLVPIVDETITVLRQNYNYEEATLTKLSKWLSVRFGLEEHPSGFPVSDTDPSRHFGLTSPSARMADTVFLAILSGTWGKLPAEMQVAA